MGRLARKASIVTAVFKGIGAEIAHELAAEGALVVANYATSQSAADKVAGGITGSGIG
jgi:3-oxoacyl-[acyl-carrier protein] reductase